MTKEQSRESRPERMLVKSLLTGMRRRKHIQLKLLRMIFHTEPTQSVNPRPITPIRERIRQSTNLK